MRCRLFWYSRMQILGKLYWFDMVSACTDIVAEGVIVAIILFIVSVYYWQYRVTCWQYRV